MPDRKLEYWYDWEIYGQNGEILEKLHRPVVKIEKDRLTDTDYLIHLITESPDSTLLNEDVWYRIVMLRKRAFKNEEDAESLIRVCRAIMRDGRSRKNPDTLDELKIMVHSDIEFFRTIQNRISDGNEGVDKTIENYLVEGTTTIEAQDRRRNELSNYKNVYYAYRRIFNRLSSSLTVDEIFSFFTVAAEHIDATNATVDVGPSGRFLTFVKMNTWYVKGEDMAIANNEEV
jgi:hypothetical protein